MCASAAALDLSFPLSAQSSVIIHPLRTLIFVGVCLFAHCLPLFCLFFVACCFVSRVSLLDSVTSGGPVLLEPFRDSTFTGCFHVERIAHMVIVAEVHASSPHNVLHHYLLILFRSSLPVPSARRSRRALPTSCRCPTCWSRCRPPRAPCAPHGPCCVLVSFGGSRARCRCPH
jgi:hypothetical protein